MTIVALVSPFSSDRNQAKSLFPEGDFVEVWVNTPANVCEQRDPKGLYKKAVSGELPNLTGVGQIYEEPKTAHIILNGTKPIEENIELLLNRCLN
jgi:bifunctional enzyme CysN/CysC